MEIVSFCSSKGGVGKTTCAINTANELANKGKRVAMLDLDPNASLTYFFKINLANNDDAITSTDVLSKPSKFSIEESAIEVSPNLFVVPSKQYEISAYESVFRQNLENSKAKLKQALDVAKSSFDYIFLDNSGGTALVWWELSASLATKIIVPVGPSDMEIGNTANFVETLKNLTEEHNKMNVEITVVPVKVRGLSGIKWIEDQLNGIALTNISKSALKLNVAHERISNLGTTVVEVVKELRSKKPEKLSTEDKKLIKVNDEIEKLTLELF